MPTREPDGVAPSSRMPPWPWLALLVLLFGPPLVSPLLASSGWMLACLAQAAAMIVFALSYNLLLGEAGLLSFGHAAHAGLGALVAAQLFNLTGLPLPLLPLAGGLGGALSGALLGAVATRRAGTAFAMITLGIGELVSAAAWSLPDWFGGAAGVPIDRTSGVALNALFGSPRAASWLISTWCFVAVAALYVLSRTPFMRVVNAVRDNPARAAALGWHPRRVRHAVLVWASGFAGVAGTLTLIDVELVSTDSVGMARSGAVLFAAVIGGTATFFGPVAGAVVFTLCSVVLARVTVAWPCYLGLLFVVIVIGAPDGIAGFVARQWRRIVRFGLQACGWPVLCGTLALATWTLAAVLAVQWLYASRLADTQGVDGMAASDATHATHAALFAALADGTGWRAPAVALVSAVVGFYAARAARRGWSSLEAPAMAGDDEGDEDAGRDGTNAAGIPVVGTASANTNAAHADTHASATASTPRGDVPPGDSR